MVVKRVLNSGAYEKILEVAALVVCFHRRLLGGFVTKGIIDPPIYYCQDKNQAWHSHYNLSESDGLAG